MKRNGASTSNNEQPLRVLVVDDSEDDALLIIHEIKTGGYHPEYERVETAEAMEKSLKNKRWDIILCDYKMPDFSAPAAIALLKYLNIEIPIIIISGAIGEETAVECMRLGAQDYIMKGNFPRLCPAIAREIEETKARNEQKQTEEELYKLALIIRNSSELINLSTLDGNMIFINEAGSGILGISPEEINQINIKEVIPDHLKDMVEKELLPALLKDGLWSGDLQYMNRKTGQISDFHATTFIIKDIKTGKPLYLANVSLDISQRKRAEGLLRESEELYTKLVDTIPDIIVRTDLEGKIIFVNNFAMEISCYKRDEIEGQNIFKFFPPEEHERLAKETALMLVSKLGPREYNLIIKNGSRIPLEINGDVLRNEDGTPFGIVTVSRDMSERKRSEEKLKERDLLFKKLSNNVPGMIYQFLRKPDGTYCVPFSTEGIRNIFGCSPEDVINDFSPIAKVILPEDFEKVIDSIEYSANNMTHWQFELRVQIPGRPLRWLFGNSTPEKLADGSIIWHGFITDITEQKLMNTELQHTLDSLRKAFGATIQVMVSAVEIRDPYTAGHQARTADIARAIATEMGLDQDKIDGIRMAGTIHDIGKLSIPAEILSKPTKLTNVEYSLIKEHPQIGYDILKDIESPWPLAEIVYQHHERINGSGYPRNLKGNEILLEARIMAVADVVEAMASHRPYRAALGIEPALEEIEKNKGVLYDINVVDVCLRLFREKDYQFL